MFRRYLVAALLVFTLAAAELPHDSYIRQVEQWRAKHQAKLAAPDGWLTVVGLDWLKEGENRVGANASDEVPLPPGSAPGQVATISFHSGKAVLHPAAGVALKLNGQPARETVMREDEDVFTINRLTFYLIRRGDRAGIRLKDQDSAARREFRGLRWYPIDPAWRIRAKFTAWGKPRTLTFDSVIGEPETDDSPGFVTFEKDGHQFKLEPVIDEGQLFFVFRDRTSGKTTYPASRFLYADMPKDGMVWLDFNQAENPPCAFTPYATCPLPPPQNRLALAVTAGEEYKGAH
jgi:uncharacterized protein